MRDTSRYARQMQLAHVGETGQQRLQRARILVIGAGGLAATLLPLLVGSGVGFIRLYDADEVDLTNLHRQVLYRMPDIGQKKVYAAKIHLQQLNPDVQIEAIAEHLHSANLTQALENIDIVVDAADRFATTYLLSDTCFVQKIPLITASVLSEQGYVGGFCGPNSPSYRAIFPHLPQQAASCQSTGVLASSVANLASLQAHMLLNLILQAEHSALGCLIQVDLARWHISTMDFQHAQEPKDSIQWVDHAQLQDNDLILELRQAHEITMPIMAAQPTRLDDLPNQPDQRRVVCVCQSGIRAAKAAKILIQRGYTQVFIMAAG